MYLCNTMIQLIKKEDDKFYMKIHDINCFFIPIDLFVERSFLPKKKIVKGSTLGWHVKGKFINYWQIKLAGQQTY